MVAWNNLKSRIISSCQGMYSACQNYEFYSYLSYPSRVFVNQIPLLIVSRTAFPTELMFR